MTTTVQRMATDAGAAPSPRPPVPRRPALVAGSGLLAMALIAPVAILVALGPVTSASSPGALAGALADSEGVARWGLLGLLVVVALDVVVAWAVREVLAPVAPGLAQLAGWLRLAYAAAFLVAAGSLVHAVDVGRADPVAGLAAVGTFTSTWETALVVFGGHLLAVAAALVVGKQAPRWVAGLVALAGIGYVVDGVAMLLGVSSGVGTVTFVGEVVLMVWLLVRAGRRP